MRHLILWLYIMTFMIGVITVTLGSLFYTKSRKKAVKYIVLADLFLGLSVFLDTFNFYMEIFEFSFPRWIYIITVYGLLFANIGVIGYLLKAVYGMIEQKVEKREQKVFYGISGVFLIFDLAVHLLTYQKVIQEGIGAHTGFVVANILSVLGAAYASYLILKNYSKIEKMIKPAVKACLIIVLIFSPISVVVNIIQYQIVFKFPIAFSPIVFLMINGVGVLLLKRCLIDTVYIFEDGKNETKSALKVDYKKLLRVYDITDREYEIVLLVLEGCSNQIIGEKLYISPHTVRNHISHIYKKTSFKNRYELMNFLMQGSNTEELPQKAET